MASLVSQETNEAMSSDKQLTTNSLENQISLRIQPLRLDFLFLSLVFVLVSIHFLRDSNYLSRFKISRWQR